MLVFDDSFSALDFKTDAALRAALKENEKDKNVIIVAQRVGTIMNADLSLIHIYSIFRTAGRYRLRTLFLRATLP